MAELTDLSPAELAAKLDQIERDYGSHGLAWAARNLPSPSLIALVRKLIAERDAMRDRLDAAAKVCDWRAAREGKVGTSHDTYHFSGRFLGKKDAGPCGLAGSVRHAHRGWCRGRNRWPQLVRSVVSKNHEVRDNQ